MGYQINQNIILTGDLNSNLFSSRNNKLIDTMNLLNLTNVIEKPTRITEHSSTLLDPIIISDSNVLNFKPDVLKEKYGYMNELTMNIFQANSIPSIGMHYFPTWRMLMKCVITSPRHSSEWQGSVFQPKWSLYVITIDHGLIANSEEKLENETVFVR